MDEINNKLKKALAWCIIFTFLLTAGIPITIIGAVNGIWGMMACGIAFIVIGFYGCPLMWTFYADKKSFKRIVTAIVKERIYSIKKISEHLNIKEKIILDRVDTCIRREFLIGYVREGDTIKPNAKAFSKTVTVKCEACGASYERELTAPAKCPYCGTILD